ncbi:twin-arginine translocation pathway signal protein [Sulfitobacter sp. SK011]|uniref:twin-arginine translocation pathway signal protein n=1 Tax=Sulfitobacter sp. SK011 TaxID=1389004 RepID=UPI000E0B27DD|nr:twin-arginine translocation pathway signal protein [Sulfitobacter sp. SK011]AXI43197.1 twin-arginine translocation pathway signal protein [Sulfitobacter sp. SK011]
MTDKTEGKSRRDFLKLAGTAAPAAVAVVAGGTTQAAAAQPADLSSETMQDTAHTRAYLESTRF